MKDGNPENSAVAEEKLWTFEFILMIILGFFMGGTSQLINASLPEYLILRGGTLTLAQTITSLMSGVAMVLRPVSGAASDMFSRKNLLLVSTVVTAACLAGYAFAPTLGVLVVIRIIHGIAFAMQGVSHLAFATSFIPKSRLGEGMGFVAVGSILAQIVGPSIGLWLNDSFGSHVMFLGAAACALASGLIVFFVPYKKDNEVSGVAPRKITDIRLSNLFAKEVAMLAVFIGIFSCGNAMISGYIKLVANERGIASIGLYFTVNSIFVLLARTLGGKLSDKKGLAFVVLPAMIIEAAAFGVFASATSLMMMFAVAVMRAFSNGIASPSIQAAAVKKLGTERSGVAISTCYIGQDLMHVVGPIAGARIYAATGSYEKMLFIYAGFVAVMAVVYFIYTKKTGEGGAPERPGRHTA